MEKSKESEYTDFKNSTGVVGTLEGALPLQGELGLQVTGEKYHMWRQRSDRVVNFPDIVGIKSAVVGTGHFLIVIIMGP